MKNFSIAFLLIFTFNSCSYFDVQEKKHKTSEIIAIVNTEKLFKEDLKDVLPNNLSKEDSIVFILQCQYHQSSVSKA